VRGLSGGNKREKKNVITLWIVWCLLLSIQYLVLYLLNTSTGLVEMVFLHNNYPGGLIVTQGMFHDVCLRTSLACLQWETQKETLSLCWEKPWSKTMYINHPTRKHLFFLSSLIGSEL